MSSSTQAAPAHIICVNDATDQDAEAPSAPGTKIQLTEGKVNHSPSVNLLMKHSVNMRMLIPYVIINSILTSDSLIIFGNQLGFTQGNPL